MTLNNNRPSILLTNINERSALGAWRSIENTNVNVIKATTIKGLQSLDHKKGVLIHPCPINEFNDFKIWIKTQLLKDNSLVVLPINEAVVYASETIRLEEPAFANRFIMPSQDSLKYTLSKFNATQGAQQAGILTPKTYFIRESFSETINIPNEPLTYPLIFNDS